MTGRVVGACEREIIEALSLAKRALELHEHTLRWLERSLEQPRQHIQWLNKELTQIRLHVDCVRAEHHAFREAADRRSKELEQIGSLDRELAQPRVLVQKLEKTCDGIQENFAKLEMDLAEGPEVNHSLERELARSRGLAEKLQMECAIFAESSARSEKELTRWRAEGESLRNELITARNRAAHSDDELTNTRQHVQWLEVELNQSRTDVANLRLRLDMVYRSRSWRVTWPMRAAHDLLRRGSQGIVAIGRWISGTSKGMAKRLIMTAIRWTQTHPRAFGMGKKVLARFPSLDGRMRALVRQQDRPVSTEYSESSFAAVSTPNQHGEGPCIDWGQYPSSVRKIYLDLKQAVERRRS